MEISVDIARSPSSLDWPRPTLAIEKPRHIWIHVLLPCPYSPSSLEWFRASSRDPRVHSQDPKRYVGCCRWAGVASVSWPLPPSTVWYSVHSPAGVQEALIPQELQTKLVLESLGLWVAGSTLSHLKDFLRPAGCQRQNDQRKRNGSKGSFWPPLPGESILAQPSPVLQLLSALCSSEHHVFLPKGQDSWLLTCLCRFL